MDPPLSPVEELLHLAYHVFLPPDPVLPQAQLEDDANQQVNMKLAGSVVSALEQYKTLDPVIATQWHAVIRILEPLRRTIEAPLRKAQLCQYKSNMRTGDSLALFIRAQNTVAMIWKKSSFTRFEVFEVQAPTEDVMSITGKITNFIDEASNILVQTDVRAFEVAAPATSKGGSEVREIRDSNNPNYFVQLFLGILQGMGELVDPPRVQKRIGNQVLWKVLRITRERLDTQSGLSE